MIVAPHQPNFMPWLGYFYKMAKADCFIFMDTVPFSEGGYTNRVKIKTAAGPHWLTVPVLTKGKAGQAIVDVMCNSAADWRKKIPKTLEANYRRCPYYEQYAKGISDIIATDGERLAELNIRLIEHFASLLGIQTPILRNSAMQAKGKATELLIALCREVGADACLSGSGGLSYQDQAAFESVGLKPLYSDFKHPTYPQAFGEFVPGLSIVDLLFNCGPDSRSVLGV